MWQSLLNRFQHSPTKESLSPKSNNFVGVFGVDNPAQALRDTFKIEPTWHNPWVAMGGAPVWTDRCGQIVVSGELVVDNQAAWRQQLGLPNADAGTLLAELYAQKGIEAAGELFGMMAVALWDDRQQQLILLRDGVGHRTLYHTIEGQACWFASRLRPLRRCPAVSGELSLTALQKYLTFSFVPGTETMWQGVAELRPGSALSLPDKRQQFFWQPTELTEQPDEPIEAHAARLRPILEAAVRDCLPASGPVGVYLSGGLDSSLVTALTVKFAPGPVHTYAIHFGSRYANELPFAQQVADHCGTRHQVLDVSGRRIRHHLFETLAALDDPIGDPLTVPNYLLGRAASQDTTLILNGEGGDPCFGGPKNQPLILQELYQPDSSRGEVYLRSYRKCYDDLPRLLKPAVQAALREAAPQEALLNPILNNGRLHHFLNKLMYINVRFKGADHILTKVNNLTTANGLLGRSPLFDQRIVAASFAIPPAYKLQAANEKAVLKRAVEDLLPPAIINRPKSGMRVPVQGWFRRELWLYARWMLLRPGARIWAYCNREVVWEWLKYEGLVWPRYGARLWLLLTLEVWLQAQD